MPNYRPIAESWNAREAGQRASAVGLTPTQARKLYSQIQDKHKQRHAYRNLRDPLEKKRKDSTVYEWQDWYLPRLLGTLHYRALARGCRVAWDFDDPGVIRFEEESEIPAVGVHKNRPDVVTVYEFHFSDDWFEMVKRRALMTVGGNLVVWASQFEVEYNGNTYVRIKLVRQSLGTQLKSEDATVRKTTHGWELAKLTRAQRLKLHKLELESMNGPVTDIFGTTTYYLNGVIHRDDGPAIITARGRKKYFQNGVEFRPTRYQRGEIVDTASDARAPYETDPLKAKKTWRRLLRINRDLGRVERERQQLKCRSKCTVGKAGGTLTRWERAIRIVEEARMEPAVQ